MHRVTAPNRLVRLSSSGQVGIYIQDNHLVSSSAFFGFPSKLSTVTSYHFTKGSYVLVQVYDSQRLTVDSQCKMDLRKFPMDTQQCEVGSSLSSSSSS